MLSGLRTWSRLSIVIHRRLGCRRSERAGNVLPTLRWNRRGRLKHNVWRCHSRPRSCWIAHSSDILIGCRKPRIERLIIEFFQKPGSYGRLDFGTVTRDFNFPIAIPRISESSSALELQRCVPGRLVFNKCNLPFNPLYFERISPFRVSFRKLIALIVRLVILARIRNLPKNSTTYFVFKNLASGSRIGSWRNRGFRAREEYRRLSSIVGLILVSNLDFFILWRSVDL